jgi:5-methylcytosine-specific restriction endonuclease McrA
LLLIVGHTPARYCSTRCSRADHRDRRRARQRDAFVEPVYRAKVFDRDDWTCHICNRPIDRHAKVPEPLAATVDHVVALACGGEHSMANARTAHFLCNAIKSDRPLAVEAECV